MTSGTWEIVQPDKPVEIQHGGVAYLIENYRLTDRQAAQDAMTTLSTSGWLLVTTMLTYTDDLVLVCVWEYRGPGKGRHFSKSYDTYSRR